MINNIEHLVYQSQKKLLDAQEIVRYRRINWYVVEKTINSELLAFVKKCSNSNFPYKFRVDTFKDRPNEQSIQLTVSANLSTY
jgi:hypothetical protein